MRQTREIAWKQYRQRRDYDAKNDREAYKTLSNQKDSELVIVNGAAHAMLMERPYYKLFRERILNFLNRG